MLPVLPVIVVVLAFNFVGDGLRDGRRQGRLQARDLGGGHSISRRQGLERVLARGESRLRGAGGRRRPGGAALRPRSPAAARAGRACSPARGCASMSL